MRTILVILGIFMIVSCGQGNKKQGEDKSPGQNAALTEVTLNIGGMDCNMCVVSVKKGIEEVAGVESATVKLSDSTAVVRFNAAKTTLAEINKAVEKRGYSVKN